MSFGNLHLHISGAGRPEARRPEPQRLERSPSAGNASAVRPGREGRRTLAREIAGDDSSVAPPPSPVRESSAAFQGKSQTDLSVVTAEGDRITISLAAQVKYAASFQTGSDGSSQTIETASSSQLRVAVQGDLNEAELKDLRTLLDKLSQASTGTSSTDVANQSTASSSDPLGFGGLTSLAAFSYRSQQTVEASLRVNLRG